MPFKSEKHKRYMWMKHPDIARKWSEKYGSDPIRRFVAKRRPSNNAGNRK